MTKIEQDLTLFFKLYLLARRQNYVEYMSGARKLAKWFDWSKAKQIDYMQPSTIYCGRCFTAFGPTPRGTFTMGCCFCCAGHDNGYEVQQLTHILGIDWNLCIYLWTKALEDIYKVNNVDVFERILF